ncbi:RNA polymerase sigma factor [Actinoplanes sp. M2I2]|uniref:RNA polymerase sigma factor n=1 Tax=Actinoplanes sp. M2I2 TaxID=1734444 RepID=UPI00201FF5E5|nr:sigma-70 family RNA polymerase sigma factor [Actinoplanes sp. M2I2]
MTATANDDRKERFRQLHAQTYGDLLRFVERRVPPAEAEDIVSTVFLTAWRRYDDLPDDARPWLFGVARGVLANQTRGWLRRRALDVRMVAEDGPADDHSGAAASRVDLQRAWRAQRPADREVLALVLFDGLTVEQAAEVAGVRVSTFAMRLSRARRRLLSAYVGTSDDAVLSITCPQAIKGQS